MEVYRGSDGEATKRYYTELEQLGPIGLVAMNLFRAQKCSERAKAYRGGNKNGSYRGQAYDRKTWSMDNLCRVLSEHGEALGIRYGWKEDPHTLFGDENSWVLYVDLPNGQVSFHNPKRGAGPDYPGEWDGQRGVAVMRILAFCESIHRSTGAHA